METIKHAAVRNKSETRSQMDFVMIGKCHPDCIQKGAEVGIKMSSLDEDQGFITSKGRFVRRGEAFQIALAAGQIDPPKNVEIDPLLFDVGTITPKAHRLFSEDLWSPEHGGKYSYDEIKGYFIPDNQIKITKDKFFEAWAAAEWGGGVENFRENVWKILSGVK